MRMIVYGEYHCKHLGPDRQPRGTNWLEYDVIGRRHHGPNWRNHEESQTFRFNG